MGTQKEEIWIETKEFEDRVEFRVAQRKKYPEGLGRKGMYEEYLSYWQSGSYVSGRVTYCFIAYKNNSWFKRIVRGLDHRNQRRIAVQECDKLIKQNKKDNKIPKIQVYKR